MICTIHIIICGYTQYLTLHSVSHSQAKCIQHLQTHRGVTHKRRQFRQHRGPAILDGNLPMAGWASQLNISQNCGHTSNHPLKSSHLWISSEISNSTGHHGLPPIDAYFLLQMCMGKHRNESSNHLENVFNNHYHHYMITIHNHTLLTSHKLPWV